MPDYPVIPGFDFSKYPSNFPIHDARIQRSYVRLFRARKRRIFETTAKPGVEPYDPVAFRNEVRIKFYLRLPEGKKFWPHEWQLDVMEAILLGVNTFQISPTGSGKTVAFQLIAIANEMMKILQLSPLTLLSEDQVQ